MASRGKFAERIPHAGPIGDGVVVKEGSGLELRRHGGHLRRRHGPCGAAIRGRVRLRVVLIHVVPPRVREGVGPPAVWSGTSDDSADTHPAVGVNNGAIPNE